MSICHFRGAYVPDYFLNTLQKARLVVSIRLPVLMLSKANQLPAGASYVTDRQESGYKLLGKRRNTSYFPSNLLRNTF